MYRSLTFNFPAQVFCLLSENLAKRFQDQNLPGVLPLWRDLSQLKILSAC